MAITSSAKKAIRSAARKRIFNLRRREALKAASKAVSSAIKEKNEKAVDALLAAAYKAIDKARKSGVIKKNTAARKKSRLARALKGTRK
jgi:small subunit ribosomal protein S20